MIYQCCDLNRKAAVLGNPTLNGINYLEVLDHDAIALGSPRQRTLLVHCLNKVPSNLTSSNILITGGDSVTGITAQWVCVAAAPPAPPQVSAAEAAYFTALLDAANTLVIRTSVAGDFSPYNLRLVNNASEASEDSFEITETLAGFDPKLAQIEFSFKVECPPNFDCKPESPDCPPDLPAAPPINYLAKDYGSFRTIILDRLSQLVPNWGGVSEADIGVMLAELIAYVGDQFSYQQDAVATEAYLRTARSRISLRRHARLVGYSVHDGCNARAWIVLQVASQVFLDHKVTRFYTDVPGMPSTLAVGAGNERAALNAGVIVFEPMHDAELYPELNQMAYYTWGDIDCCLPIGATEATLLGSYPNLHPGAVLIFQEVIGPQTGIAADADIRHRCAVRLTGVTTQNAQGQPLVDPLFENGTGKIINSTSQTPTLVTEIQWSSDDALKFPVCISSTFLNSKGDEQTLTGVSVVYGNVVLADQGLGLDDILLPTVPQPSIFQPPNLAVNRCNPANPTPYPVRYRPQVPESPVTQAVPLTIAGSPITPSIVHLLSNGWVDLMDAKGNISLMIEADEPREWPQFFGVIASKNTLDPANLDLTVVYAPTAGTAVPLEVLSNLSLTSTDVNYAVTQINALSKFIQVPTASAVGPAPATLPTAPTMLSNIGTTNLQSTSAITYLVIEPLNPFAWPANFGVIAQGNQEAPSEFNLVVVYDPPSGGVGVLVPVVVETFEEISLSTVSEKFNSISQLVAVRAFDQEPSPSLSAFDLMSYEADQAVPAISLTGTLAGSSNTWMPQADLLAAAATDRDFVVEVESDGSAYLRFGDDTNGLLPLSGTTFTASCRIGNGSMGNVGANTLIHFAGDPRVQSCTNPLAASGGVDMETNEQIRRRAPQAFLTQERAITMQDYEDVAEKNPLVENAVATLRWTGSWYTVFITAEPRGAGNLTRSLTKSLDKTLNRYRLAGQDIQLESPQYVPLEIKLSVCVNPQYFRSNVQAALLQVLGSQMQVNGQKGFFYPDNFTFGQTVYLSPIYAAARKVAGVDSITATVFQPQGVATNRYLQEGEIPLGPFQIARMDNDPSLPDHGQLTLVMQGGK